MSIPVPEETIPVSRTRTSRFSIKREGRTFGWYPSWTSFRVLVPVLFLSTQAPSRREVAVYPYFRTKVEKRRPPYYVRTHDELPLLVSETTGGHVSMGETGIAPETYSVCVPR